MLVKKSTGKEQCRDDLRGRRKREEGPDSDHMWVYSLQLASDMTTYRFVDYSMR